MATAGGWIARPALPAAGVVQDELELLGDAAVHGLGHGLGERVGGEDAVQALDAVELEAQRDPGPGGISVDEDEVAAIGAQQRCDLIDRGGHTTVSYTHLTLPT